MGNIFRSELSDSSSNSSIYESDTGSSTDLTSKAHEYNGNADDEDLYSDCYSEPPLERLRSILKATQGNVSQCEEVINDITSFDGDLNTKCETIAVTNLLPHNSTLADAGNFPVISMGVDIFVNYGINLLKPEKSPNWQSIRVSNGVFKNEVQPLKIPDMCKSAEQLKQLGGCSLQRTAQCLDFDYTQYCVEIWNV